jgi:hypothetical protein
MYTHQIQYTKNMLSGALQGSQLQSSFRVPGARLAATWALALATGGIHRDVFTGAAYTAHNVRLVSIEPELPELVEDDEDGRYEAADMAYDLAEETR